MKFIYLNSYSYEHENHRLTEPAIKLTWLGQLAHVVSTQIFPCPIEHFDTILFNVALFESVETCDVEMTCIHRWSVRAEHPDAVIPCDFDQFAYVLPVCMSQELLLIFRQEPSLLEFSGIDPKLVNWRHLFERLWMHFLFDLWQDLSGEIRKDL